MEECCTKDGRLKEEKDSFNLSVYKENKNYLDVDILFN